MKDIKYEVNARKLREYVKDKSGGAISPDNEKFYCNKRFLLNEREFRKFPIMFSIDKDREKINVDLIACTVHANYTNAALMLAAKLSVKFAPVYVFIEDNDFIFRCIYDYSESPISAQSIERIYAKFFSSLEKSYNTIYKVSNGILLEAIDLISLDLDNIKSNKNKEETHDFVDPLIEDEDDIKEPLEDLITDENKNAVIDDEDEPDISVESLRRDIRKELSFFDRILNDRKDENEIFDKLPVTSEEN